MKYLFLLSFALIINMNPAYAQSKSLAAEVAATAMATLWKVPVGADTAKPTKWTYGQSIGLIEEILKSSGFEIVDIIKKQYIPSEEDLKKMEEELLKKLV